jgi:signal transduction histidine kinase/YHS domain-containing protein
MLFTLAMLIVGNIWFIYRVLFPLRRLSAQAQRLTKGDFDALSQPVGGIAEIDNVRYAMDCMVGHVRRAQQASQQYAQSLADGQEAERARLARELHDDTVQSLVAVSQSIDIALQWLNSQPEQAATMLQAARQQSIDTIQALRNLIADLRPPALNELGLVPAIEMHAARLQNVNVPIHIEGTARRLSEAHELTLFRIAQEALNNAYRHSGASQIKVTLHYHPDAVRLTVSDNGRGFNLHNEQGQGHYGLRGIQERVHNLSGTIEIQSQPGQGTTVNVWIPESALQQPERTVQDPVCHASINPNEAYGSLVYNSVRYYFCCPVCQGAFQKDPEAYLATQPPS